MVFSSALFLFYFLPIFLLVYYLIDPRYKNAFLLGASVFFYAWGAPSFVLLALVSVVFDFYLVHWMNKQDASQKKWYLLISVLLNLGMLFYYKYANFFVENVNHLLGVTGSNGITWLHIALPAGISFFVFKKISYTVDVYRGTHPPMENLMKYSLFIFLFPELIAGPIVRFNEIGYQINERRDKETLDNKLWGFYRFVLGLSKKVLIANVVAKQVDEIFTLAHEDLTTPLAWLGIIGYSVQIYFDFSGYSDMAIGLARMIGFQFPENFDNPYISRNITEFWRRWHITLGRWMKDYLYIPLGGNRVSINRMYFNLFLVFLLSGFWHGASWNFIVWGAFHGMFLIADRLFLVKWLDKAGRLPSILATYLVVLIGWVFFRTDTLFQAGHYLSKMFTFDWRASELYIKTPTLVTLYLGLFFSFFCLLPFGSRIQERLFSGHYPLSWLIVMSLVCVVLLGICSSFIISSGFNPFIYYRF